MRPPTSKLAPTPSAGALAAPDANALLRDLRSAFDALFLGRSHVVLAVSGGPDSMALLQLAAQWSGGSGKQFSVVTVDHGLRAESAAEAEMVARECERLRWPHKILRWIGNKPATGIQEAARAARLALISQHLSAHGLAAVATAHTADDQAETVLMRLARGSGVDGLAAMRPLTQLAAGQVVLRPLLGVTKQRLLSALPAWGCAWVEDPSNHVPKFERVRVRRARAALMAQGIDFDSKALARTAARMARASDALQHAISASWAARPAATALHGLGWAEVDWDWLLGLPEEIRLRLLAALLETVGGHRPLSLGQLEQQTIKRRWLPLQGTLNGVQMSKWAGSGGARVVLMPELDQRQTQAPDLQLVAGVHAVWDGRFEVAGWAGLAAGFRIAALGRNATHEIDAHWLPLRPSANLAALYRLPAIWAGDQLAAVPSLAYIAAPFRTAGLENVQCALLRPVFDRPDQSNPSQSEALSLGKGHASS